MECAGLKAAFWQGLPEPWDPEILTELACWDDEVTLYSIIKAMDEYDQEALQQGYIQASISLASAGFSFLEKKKGSLQPCIDYRGLNQISVKYPYPLPRIPSALQQLRSAHVFTKLDLQSTYNLVCMIWKTQFSNTSRHYECMVMPYRLSCVPSGFQHFTNDMVRDMLGKYVIAYVTS